MCGCLREVESASCNRCYLVFMGLSDEQIAELLMQLDDQGNDDFIVHEHDDSEPEEEESCEIVSNSALELTDAENSHHTFTPRTCVTA